MSRVIALILYPPEGRWRAFVQSRLALVLVWVLLTTDLLVGLNWLILDAVASAGPAYVAAQIIAPMHTWGAVFVVYALGGMLLQHRVPPALTAYMVGSAGGALWFVWAALFVWAGFTQPQISWLGAIVSTCLCAVHILVGLAIPVRREVAGCGR